MTIKSVEIYPCHGIAGTDNGDRHRWMVRERHWRCGEIIWLLPEKEEEREFSCPDEAAIRYARLFIEIGIPVDASGLRRGHGLVRK